MAGLLKVLYDTFIPKQPRPLRVQAENALYVKTVDISNPVKRPFWKFWSNTEACSPDDASTIVSNSDMVRRCSFETITRDEESIEKGDSSEKAIDYVIGSDPEKLPVIDRFIQLCVQVTGSFYTFVFVWMIIILWVVLGIVYNAPNNWQIVMQDGQSIQTYIWNTFLMRQQLDDSQKFLAVYGELRSRLGVLKKLVCQLKEERDKGIKNETATEEISQQVDEEKAPSLSWFEHLSNFMTKVLGTVPSIVVFWIGIFIWIGCGALYSPTGNSPPFTGKYTGSNPKYGKFTNQWQMYINTAIALELLITSVFLENLRLRNNNTLQDDFAKFVKLDTSLELKFRQATGYTGENQCVIVRPMERKGFQKIISFYAGAIGNGLGLAVSCCVFAAWIGIGGVLNWNDNWWLIIGTYTGLMGFIDSIVLREVYYSLTEYEDSMFETVIQGSQELLDIVGYNYEVKCQDTEVATGISNLGLSLSRKVNYYCSTKYTVMAAVTTVVGLVIMGCAMKWSEMAQLIANTPTMIIEGFFLLILIQAHDFANAKKAKMVRRLTKSRELLSRFVDQSSSWSRDC